MEKWKKIREKSGFSRKGGTKETREKKEVGKEGRKEGIKEGRKKGRFSSV